jgi:hypothetical protein
MKQGNPKRAPRPNWKRAAAIARNHEKGVRELQDTAHLERRLEYLLDCGRIQMALQEGLIDEDTAATLRDNDKFGACRQ